MWYRLIKIERGEQSEIRADIKVPATSPWFDGHFPGEPVLPGLAQISMVFDVIQKASEGDLRVSSVSRVRFKRIVRPDDCLEVIAAPLEQEKDVFTFRMQIQGDLVCSGVMRLKRESTRK
jgi:3-hydroxyacyl-[acyl-carrier-protein] dehydratase